MIKSVTVTNYHNESLKIELASPEKSGLLITNIEGLGPAGATINSTPMALSDGESYNSARLDKRNITFTIHMYSDKSIESSRYICYKFFPTKKWVKLLFETDERLAYCEGYVESNEPDIFSKEESCEISIICPDPYFYSAKGGGYVITPFSGITPLFEFPFDNNSLTERLIEMGSIDTYTEKNIYYDGEVEAGLKVTFHSIGNDVSGIRMYNLDTNEGLSIDDDILLRMTGSGILNRDDIIINSRHREHSVYLLRDGVYTNILNAINRDADWFTLAKGDNLLAYTATSGLTNLQVRAEHQILYGGI